MRCVAAASAVGMLLLAGGCISDKPGSASLASTVIQGATLAQIQDATIRVFETEGYAVAAQDERRLIFEREGTQKDRVMYGQYGEDLRMRVDVAVEPYRLGGYLLRADAFALAHAVGPSTKVMRIARRPYQAMLDSVRASLVSSEPAGR